MGRAFEYRKAAKFKRWGNMARVFTRIGRHITIAAKNGGIDPENNPHLRALIQEAKSENMPKDNIERAIKRAVEKDKADIKEIVYEGYLPHGIAIVVETATDNSMRTVANIRSYFNKYNGSLGTTGSLDFVFEHKCVFKVKDNGVNLEDLELELIDFGVEDIFKADEGEIIIYGPFDAYGNIQKYVEDNNFELISGGFDRIPLDMKEVTPEQRAEIEKALAKFEEDEDVTNVYHNMKHE
ncbi:MAG: YebC/PmpR family DNA-binding transcriptional regulator [Bacteroidales bacterium]|nr:YebC/PmpR family DNA-binding transcriptional regulator [Bacteroidales bacterium]